jgi:class 3 adenylate cyclase
MNRLVHTDHISYTMSYSEDFVRRIKLKNEHTRSAAFLQHMLPAVVIDELSRMAGSGHIDQYVAHERSNCSVFFCDIVSFTTLASSIPPEDVVAILNVIFATFDALTQHFDVYKVETIGIPYHSSGRLIDTQIYLYEWY